MPSIHNGIPPPLGFSRHPRCDTEIISLDEDVHMLEPLLCMISASRSQRLTHGTPSSWCSMQQRSTTCQAWPRLCARSCTRVLR